MHANAELITRFYRSFQQLDSAGMIACYHPDIHFSDPAFPNLHGKAAGAMWRMLCSQAKGFELTFRDVQADDTTGSAHWEPIYIFSKTGRRVHNKIDATFAFKDGKIIRHVDYFDFWAWSRMALGPAGLFMGWTPFLKDKVQQTAAQALQKYMSKAS